MYALKVALKDAQRAKVKLAKLKILDNERRIVKENGFLFLPVIKKGDIDIGGFVEVEAEVEAEKKRRTGSLKDILKGVLSDKEIKGLKRAFEIVGSIAIIEVPPMLEEKEKVIAEAILNTNKNIKTVVKKASAHEGVFRIQRYKHILGEETTKSIMHENNTSLKVDIAKAYFSSKMAHERQRITGLVKPGEKILVMFSGVAPYPCIIAKNTKAEKITGIEINEDAHRLGLENVKLNKLKNVDLLVGDVRFVIPILQEKGAVFDRILMPAPKTGEEFLDLPFKVAKKESTVHLYTFCFEKDLAGLGERIKAKAKELGHKIKILDIVQCGQVGVRKYRVCIDFKVE